MDRRKIAMVGVIGLLLLLLLGAGIFMMNRGGNIAFMGTGVSSAPHMIPGVNATKSQNNGNTSAPGTANPAPNGNSNPSNGNTSAPGTANPAPNGNSNPSNGNTLPGANVNANPSSNANGNANVGNTSDANRCLNVTSGSAQASACSNLSQMPPGAVNTGQ